MNSSGERNVMSHFFTIGMGSINMTSVSLTGRCSRYMMICLQIHYDR